MIITDRRGVKYNSEPMDPRFKYMGEVGLTHTITRTGPRLVDSKREDRRMRREEKISAGVNTRTQWPPKK